MDISLRIEELGRLRRTWSPVAHSELLARRRAHAAWCNAGIEGNPLSWPRARSILGFGRAQGAPGLDAGARASELPGSEPEGLDASEARAARELLGCVEIAAFLEDWSERADLALVRHLHAQLMTGLGAEAGMLRTREVAIVRESGLRSGQTVFRPPHPAQVPELLSALLSTLEPEEDPFHAAGRFHYEFQSIHPFADGNGRLGRALSSWLARRGWEARGFHLEPAVARAGPGYYLALRAVRPDYRSEIRDALRPWLLPFFDMVEDALRHPETPEETADAEPSPEG